MTAAVAQSACRQDALSDSERLLIVSMRRLSHAIADRARGLQPAEADQVIAREVFLIVDTLGGVSNSFSIESAKYLTDAVHRLRQN